MERLSLTSFGRQPVTAGQLATLKQMEMGSGIEVVSKWDVLRDVTVVRCDLGLNDRDVSVLGALLSFHPGKDLKPGSPIVVFPSNRSLAERAHGMAESTLRRHLANLVKAGLILRHDSPNGKRYARKGPGGVIALAFGFDLSPLVHLAGELAFAAQRLREEHAALLASRERSVLMVRDAGKLIAYGLEATPDDPRWCELQEVLRDAQRRLRRKPTTDGMAELQGLCERLSLIHISEPTRPY